MTEHSLYLYLYLCLYLSLYYLFCVPQVPVYQRVWHMWGEIEAWVGTAGVGVVVIGVRFALSGSHLSVLFGYISSPLPL